MKFLVRLARYLPVVDKLVKDNQRSLSLSSVIKFLVFVAARGEEKGLQPLFHSLRRGKV